METHIKTNLGRKGVVYRKRFNGCASHKTFGLRDKDGKFYIGNKEAKIKDNNIIVGDKTYTGTPGLWKLIVARSPDNKIFTNGDYDNYAEIMHSTNALRRNNDESETKPKASNSWKWRHILKPIWDEKELYTGKGLTAALPTRQLDCRIRMVSFTSGTKKQK